MPMDFSVACYRLGHSLIRPGYRLNDDDKTLFPIFMSEHATKLVCRHDLQALRACAPMKVVDRPAEGQDPSRREKVGDVFKQKCPLWTYILAEAIHKPQETFETPVKEKKCIPTPQVGQVGGRIVGEVFLGLLFGGNHSVI